MQKLALIHLSCVLFVVTFAQHIPTFQQIPAIRPFVKAAAPTFNAASRNYELKYYVIKKDSTDLLVNSKIYLDDDGKHYLIDKDDSDRRIYPNQTLKITVEDQADGRTFEGIADDSNWLFKIVSGKINLYCFYPPPVYISNDCINAFQIGDGPIEYWGLGIENLISALEQNKKAKAIFLKDNEANNNNIKGVRKFNREYK